MDSHQRKFGYRQTTKPTPEPRKLVEQRNALFLPGTLRRRYYPRTQRTVFAPKPVKRRQEEIAKIDAELKTRENILRRRYLPIQRELHDIPEEAEIYQEQTDTE